eukprot:scaffold7428_cov248-Pinguiococcus_pyrenoidosus.AAC.7
MKYSGSSALAPAEWMLSNSLVQSVPSVLEMASTVDVWPPRIQPGWCWTNLVMSYTLPRITTHASSTRRWQATSDKGISGADAPWGGGRSGYCFGCRTTRSGMTPDRAGSLPDVPGAAEGFRVGCKYTSDLPRGLER